LTYSKGEEKLHEFISEADIYTSKKTEQERRDDFKFLSIQLSSRTEKTRMERLKEDLE
jgi:hypothetical protein